MSNDTTQDETHELTYDDITRSNVVQPADADSTPALSKPLDDVGEVSTLPDTDAAGAEPSSAMIAEGFGPVASSDDPEDPELAAALRDVEASVSAIDRREEADDADDEFVLLKDCGGGQGAEHSQLPLASFQAEESSLQEHSEFPLYPSAGELPVAQEQDQTYSQPACSNASLSAMLSTELHKMNEATQPAKALPTSEFMSEWNSLQSGGSVSMREDCAQGDNQAEGSRSYTRPAEEQQHRPPAVTDWSSPANNSFGSQDRAAPQEFSPAAAAVRRGRVEDVRKRGWGKPWQKHFPTEAQICKAVTELRVEHERLRGELKREANARDRQQNAQAAAAATAVGSASSFGGSCASECPPTPLVASERTIKVVPLGSCGSSTVGSATMRRNGSMPELQPYNPRSHMKSHKHDPGKVVGANGKVALRGVASTSDIQRYTKGVDMYSPAGQQLRGAYKLMRMEQHSKSVTNAWNALHSFTASDKPFDQWYSKKRGGGRRDI